MALSAQRGRQADGELATSRSSSPSSGWFEALAEDVAEQLRELDPEPALHPEPALQVPVGNLVSRATAHVAVAPVSAVAPWALQKPDLRLPAAPSAESSRVHRQDGQRQCQRRSQKRHL